jgi:limonene-1,2-epoxide hydrolase
MDDVPPPVDHSVSDGSERSADMARRCREILDVVDEQDAGRFAGYLTEDGSFCFGNLDPAVGRSAIVAAVTAFFATIAELTHEVLGVWVDGDVVVCEMTVTYQRLDGRSVTLPACNVFRMRGELVHDYRVFIDVGPLYAD